MTREPGNLWRRWVAANALGELVGLGATFGVVGLLTPRIDARTPGGVLLAFAVAVTSGAVEATVVGLAQWWAMHPWFPTVRRNAWWRATLVGALLGYVLGYLPSTLLSLRETASPPTPATEPPPWITLPLASVLGAVAGAVLSLAQWRELRRAAARAGGWIPANMLAWALGMPVLFLGMDVAFARSALWQSVLVVGGALLAAGAVVGAVHGRCLVRLAEPDP